MTVCFIPTVGGPEWIIILVIILLLFGGSKVPELARSLGKAKTEFKKGMEEEAEPEKAKEQEEKKQEEAQ
jgi:sec-independent protein translocase protein TatA